MKSISFQIARVAFWAMNVFVALIVLPILLHASIRFQESVFATVFIERLDLISALLVLSAITTWICIVIMWFQTLSQRSNSRNLVILSLIIVGNIFSIYWFYLKRHRMFGLPEEQLGTANETP